MWQLLIVDATNRASVMYADGKTPDVVNLFMREVKRTAAMLGGALPILCWDHPDGSSNRKAKYAGYKSTRPKNEERPAAVAACLAAAKEKYLCWFDAGYEADDLAASLSTQYAHLSAVIHSRDSDLHQLLVGPNRLQLLTTTFKRQNIVYAGVDYVQKKYGVRIEQWVDYRVMAGDSSDAIAGVPGVGPKTAVNILEAYPTLDAAIAAGEELRKVKLVSKKIYSALHQAYEDGTIANLREIVRLDCRVAPPAHIAAAIDAIEPPLPRLSGWQLANLLGELETR